VRFRYDGTGFLHRMVRIMTGTLLDVGAGGTSPDEMPAMLDARDRRAAGPTAPPQGLSLVNVRYPNFASSDGASIRRID
jgi:tRNA pseudouridine38-40 synthase